MSTLVAVYTVPHVPLITAVPQAPSQAKHEFVYGTFERIAQDLEQREIDTLILVANDHMNQYFYTNMPTLGIGTGETATGPIDKWLKIPDYTFSINSALADHLLRVALEADFDPVISENPQLDHGHMIPFHFLNGKAKMRVIPIFQNAVMPPMPSLKRSYRLGEVIRKAIETHEGNDRVAVVGAGGLSHFVGTEQMGWVNETFDQQFLEDFTNRRIDQLFEYNDDVINTAGNGAHEVRNWMAALGAAPKDSEIESLGYMPINEWITGCGFVRIVCH